MAETAPELKRIVKRYRLQLQKMGIRPTRVLLYGSQAMGTAREGSDIDLIVISGDWEKYNQRQRLELLGVAAARILEPIQAQGFTPNARLQRWMAETSDPFDTGPRDPKTGMLQLGQEFTIDKWKQR